MVLNIDTSGRNGADIDDDEGGDGEDLPAVGSDCGSDDGADHHVPPAAGVSDETADARADSYCGDMPAALHNGAWRAEGATSGSSLLCQHARCATHTLQLSVRAGLAVPAVLSVLQKVRLVVKLCRTSTNLQRELRVALEQDEAAEAARDGRDRIGAAKLASRLIIDCPTRWGSTLARLRRFVRAGPAVPSALSTNYHYTPLTVRKVSVECPNQSELDALEEVISFLRVLESASESLGSEANATSSMEEATCWCLRRAGAADIEECAALSALKRAVLANMRERRETERLRAPNPAWFGICVAAVLFNPFYKSSTVVAEVSTATTARSTALQIIRWMVARAPSASAGAPPTPASEDGSPPNKHQRTFENCLRESMAPPAGATASASQGVGVGLGGGVPLAVEWSAYLGRTVDQGSRGTALDWWRENEMHFSRVALGARYLLSISATSVTSELVFSKAGRTVSKLRARLTGANAEQYIVLHDDITRSRRMAMAKPGRM